MVCDIFKTNYKTTNVKLKEAEIKIDLDDPIFLKYKNMHLAKALDAIRVDLSQFKEDNQAAKMQKAGNEKEI